MLAFIFAPLLALGAAAIQVTAPSNSSGWTSQGSQLIQWSAVSTDPSNFTIQLINPSSPNSPVTIAQNVKTSDNSYIYTPSTDLQAGQQWRVNLISTSNTAGILAQSEYFAVSQGVSTVTPTAAQSSTSGSTGSPSSTQSGTASATTSLPGTTSSRAAADVAFRPDLLGVFAFSVLALFA